ncbi:PhnD/SsuA/transferrin family substrate-binding protein [Pseudomonas sp. CFBP 8770]|uniref:phosphate/phosphite/phosphonate ABC transporter substrate-binding protein n=1 Tax=unclassified Pseudomonas TaxID=196821 RepID=UPI00177D3C8B|nr:MULTISPECIES: PhnD/SsuA/transferrin family substrate-binding protein [unclassified Pseudomonas]MBD8472980.1 PhnD/SsuA/transferrin family substrate-binding protein [Pseudomonas sp. CFBP 8773]MBD8645917.1 PhnD/SsuA/transferrin family substrate-binding protein [Pseudomonas sp. CFBP 8770]
MSTDVIAALPMYPAPAVVGEAYRRWLEETLQLLGTDRPTPWPGSLAELWLHPRLLLAQTCGLPLITELKHRVRIVGRPHFALPEAQAGQHCSLLIARLNDPRQTLAEFFDCRGAYNSLDSNSGMNLLRHALIPHVREGRFFKSVQATGSHRQSIAHVATGIADLAAIDSVTFAYLARHAPNEVAGVRVVERTANAPTLPYITSLHGPEPGLLREAMNAALAHLPEVAAVLAITTVQVTAFADYEVLLEYRDKARRHIGQAGLW